MATFVTYNRCACYNRWNETPSLSQQSQIRRQSSNTNASRANLPLDRLLRKIAFQIKRFLAKHNVRIDFYIDPETQHVLGRIISNESGKVIRETPMRTKSDFETNTDVKI